MYVSGGALTENVFSTGSDQPLAGSASEARLMLVMAPLMHSCGVTWMPGDPELHSKGAAAAQAGKIARRSKGAQGRGRQ